MDSVGEGEGGKIWENGIASPGSMLAFKCETAGFFPLLQSPNHKTNVSFLPEAFLCFSFQDLKH